MVTYLMMLPSNGWLNPECTGTENILFVVYIWVNIHFRTSYELIAEQQKTRSELIHAIAIQAEETMVRMGYITGWWLTYPSEKYEFVSWDDDIPIYGKS